MRLLTIPRAFFACRDSLELEELPEGLYRTICSGAHECYGCNGKFTFRSPIHPDRVKEIAHHTAPDVMSDRWGEESFWMSGKDIAGILLKYPEEGHYYLRDLWCDLDTVFVYAEVKE